MKNFLSIETNLKFQFLHLPTIDSKTLIQKKPHQCHLRKSSENCTILVAFRVFTLHVFDVLGAIAQTHIIIILLHDHRRWPFSFLEDVDAYVSNVITRFACFGGQTILRRRRRKAETARKKSFFIHVCARAKKNYSCNLISMRAAPKVNTIAFFWMYHNGLLCAAP